MAVEKPMEPSDILIMEPELDIEIEAPMEIDVIEVEMDDGSVVIDFGEGTDSEEEVEHDSNLAEFIEDDELEFLANELIESFVSDRSSRGEWANAYIKGMDLLGMKVEERTEPWNGASGVSTR